MRAVEPLWPIPLPVIVATGEHGSGKTLFGLTIAAPEETGVFDLELSSAPYESMGFHRWDVPAEVSKANGGRPYKAIDVYKWWRRTVDGIKPGRFRVLMIDPASEIEAGLSDYVWNNPAEFGKTKALYAKSSALFQADVKELWKLIGTQLAAKVETLYFTVHLRLKFEGNAPTGKKEPKGRTTLSELASLFLWLDRKPDARGAVPDLPSATVRKSRLVHTSRINGKPKIVPALPPRLPVATPDAIRAYMLAPPDAANLRPEECAPEAGGMTEDERLEMQAVIARDQKEAAIAALELATAGGGKAAVKATPPPPAPPEPAPEADAPASPPGEGMTLQEAMAADIAISEPAPESPPELAPADGVMDSYAGPVADGQLIAMSGLRKEWERLAPPSDRDERWRIFLSRWNVTGGRELNAAQAHRAIETLKQIVAELRTQHATFRDN